MQNLLTIPASTEIVREVTTADGYRLQYRAWTGSTPVGTIVLLNGLISHSGWFREIGHALAKRGLKVIGADRRGSGLNREGRGDAPSGQILLSDVKTVLDRESNGAPAWIAGWCWGAVLAINVAVDLGDQIQGLALFAPGLFPSNEIKMAARRTIEHNGFADPEIACLPSPLADEMFSTNPRILSRIANDPLVQRSFTPRLFAVSRELSMRAALGLRQLACPVLLILAGRDSAVDNERTAEAFRRTQTDLHIVAIDSNHAIQFEAPQRLSTEIADWIAHSAAREGCGTPESRHLAAADVSGKRRI